jgi:hypothetical protein
MRDDYEHKTFGSERVLFGVNHREGVGTSSFYSVLHWGLPKKR